MNFAICACTSGDSDESDAVPISSTATVPTGARFLVAACGGGGGSGGITAGIDRGGFVTATGSITGSVHVNGVHYATTGAVITLDDNPGTESDLRVGQVVRIEGRIEQDGINGTATRVIFDDEVEGPVQSIDLANSRLVVLGRTVEVSNQTSFDDSIAPRSLEGLAVGDRIEVSGPVATTGVAAATRIERKTAQPGVEVKGAIAALDTNARSFALSQLTVSYASAQLNGFASGQPANGDYVEAFGTVDGNGRYLHAPARRPQRRLDARRAACPLCDVQR